MGILSMVRQFFITFFPRDPICCKGDMDESEMFGDSTDCGGYGGTRQYRLWGLWWYSTVQIVGVMVVLDSRDCGGYGGTRQYSAQ